MPRLPRVSIDFDTGAAAYAVIAAARLTAIKRPFGDDVPGRVLLILTRYLHGSRRLRNRQARRPFPLRIAFAGAGLVLFLHFAYLLTTSFCLYIFKTVDPAATTLMVYRAKANKWKISKPIFVPLAKIPKATRNMTVRVEDGNFFSHRGIDPEAIKHAYDLNKGLRSPIYGGSTITMQTARTIFLIPDKSYIRKYLEAIIALEMEAILGKNRILELYFNYAEWGRGIFGIEAASRHHYKTGVASLSADQAIRLVTLLSSPIRFSPYEFGRNGILWSRYEYLNKRWGEQPEPEPLPEVPLSTGGEHEGDAPAEASGASDDAAAPASDSDPSTAANPTAGER